MAEGQLRQIWAGLMPSFPEPATLLDVSDPDDRAITMLLKTLYVVFKGVLEERHQLRCSDHRTSSTGTRTTSTGPRTTAAGPRSNSAEPRNNYTGPRTNSSTGPRTNYTGPHNNSTEPRNNSTEPQNNSTEPRNNSTEPRNNSTGPDATAAILGAASVEELVPSSPGDLVPPSPGNVTYFSETRRTAAAYVPARQPAVLVPETVDVASPSRAVSLPRPIAETAPAPPLPPAVWVPETLETSPLKPRHRPCPVAETVPPPSTPPRSLRQSEAVSPVLPGRCPASRRARRAASRAGPVSTSPAPSPTLQLQPPPLQPPPLQPPPLQPPPLQPPPPLPLPLTLTETTAAVTTAAAAATAAAEKDRVEAVSPTPSLSSPLLLPQRLVDMSRRPAVAEATVAESPKRRTEGAVVGPARGISRLSRSKLSRTGGNSASAPAQGASKPGSSRQAPVKKRKYMIIGPNDPVPPRKPRVGVAASPQKNFQQEAAQQESSSTLSLHRRPPDQSASTSGALSPTRSSARAAAAVTPAKRSAQSIFELSTTSSEAQQRSTSSKGHTSNSGPVAGKRTPPRRTSTPKKSAEQRLGSAPAGAAGRPAPSAESVVEIDVLLEELDNEGGQTQAQGQDGVQTQAQGQGGVQTQGQARGQGQHSGRGLVQGDSRDQGELCPGDGDGGHHQAASWPEQRGDAPDREDPHAHGDIGAEPQETTAPPGDHQTEHQTEHDSQEETQMDSLVFGDQQPVAGPAYKYDAGPVRRRADRQKLPGWSCNLCKQWYADRDMTEEQLQAHMNRCSRHRQKDAPPPDTPPGFWDPVGFPSMNITQYGGDGPRTRARRKL